MQNESTQSATVPIGNMANVEQQRLIENYIAILEKTNQQLGVWSNPYGVAIGILSLLIAIIAIFVAISIWRHSKEQKDRADKFFSDQEKIIQEKNKNIQQIELKYDKLIKGYEKQQKSKLKSTKEDRKEVQRLIDDLKKEKAGIGAYISPAFSLATVASPTIAPWTTPGAFLNLSKSLICAKCGKSFSYYDPSSELSTTGSLLVTAGNTRVHCTHCGHLNIT